MHKKTLLLRCGILIPNVLTYNLTQAKLPVNAQEPALPVAQNPNPNQDRFPQDIPIPQPIAPNTDDKPVFTPQQVVIPEVVVPSTRQSSVNILVKKVEVAGSTIFKLKDIQPITAPVTGRSVTLQELQKVVDSITELYVQRGYITSRAVLEEQKITDGVVKIRVIEGSVEKIEVDGAERINPEYITSRIALGAGTPLNKDKLEDQLILLRNDPLFTKVEASIKPGSKVGQSILTVRVTEAKAFSATAMIDNYSPPSVGSERFGVGASYRNLTGLGDELSAAYYRSFSGGSTLYDFNYKVPVNAMNGTVQLRVAPSRSKITDSKFAAFGIRSNSELYELSYRQPLIRSAKEEFALSVGFALQNGQTFLFQNTPFPFGIGPDADGNSRTRVVKFGQDYVKRDTEGAWALRSQFNFGLGIFDATVNSSPIPDGQFFSWQGQVQRVQRLGNDNLLIAQADVQLTPDSLLPSQQFVIGGGQSLRGYRQNARSGDNGIRFSLEDRIALVKNESGQPTLQLAPFVDLGAIWNNSSNPNKLPKQNFLAGAGLGVIWQPMTNLQVRADYGVPLVRLDDKGNNAQDQGLYFNVIYNY
ncbi:MAG: ShlB/FhaC/HecB family hemolysin secretion/activation protein [Calothrix sp. C42_A2020_038]|nr:ShlB/FhaC/HecB family hemolysin secretion/activation protein [Calothrix sp. C42_A2020_038]